MQAVSLPSRRAVARLVLAVLGLTLFPPTTLAGTRLTPHREESPTSLWTEISEESLAAKQEDRWIVPEAYRVFELDRDGLTAVLRNAPMEFSGAAKQSPLEISLPMPSGSLARFRVEESPIMEPALAAEFPYIKTYIAQGIDDPTASARLDLTPQGFHAMVISPNGWVFIDPYRRSDDTNYVVYYKKDFKRDLEGLQCYVEGPNPGDEASQLEPGDYLEKSGVSRASGDMLRTYRVAVAGDVEYTTFHGGTVALGQAAIVTAINRVTAVYEVEIAARLTLVANNSSLVYTAEPDPYTDNNPSALLTQNQANIDLVIGTLNYDVGHVFTTGGGGLAGLGVTCTTGQKARGETGLPAPTGDPFYIDFVAHELGHQFGGNHTFNGTVGNCAGGNRNGATAYEPGSGSTIQAYAGICGSDDLQSNSDAYFHAISYQEMRTRMAGGGACGTLTATGNTAPTIDAGPNFTIPVNTPFELTASGGDPNGDTLTYCWEEFDLGPGQAMSGQTDNGASPIFRSFSPSTSPTRTFPRLTRILNNNNVGSIGELLPTTSRTMTFRATARDNRAGGGGVEVDSMTVTSSTVSSTFAVTAPNTAVTWTGGTPQTVTWNVASSNLAPVSAANVDILISIDGGANFTTLLASTPNDGTQLITVPSTTTTQARIKVKGTGNIFFDISNANFTIQSPISVQSATLTAESCSPPNNRVDPGETVTMDFTLANAGTATTSLVATLQASGGVTSPSGAQNYGVIPHNGTGTQSFTFTASSSLACGDTIVATLQAQDGANDLGTTSISITTGLTINATQTYNGSGGAIPDPASSLTRTITVADVGTITDVNAKIRIDHARIGQVRVTLTSPNGTSVVLVDQRGGNGDNIGSGACPTPTFTVFDDASTTAISAGSPPFTAVASYDAESVLSVMNGGPSNGTWTLLVEDLVTNPSETGSLLCWAIDVSRTSTTCSTGCAPGAAPSVTVDPGDQTVCSGQSASFTAAATGSPDPTVQWQISTGGPFSNLTLAPPYSVVTNSSAGTTTSTLTVNPATTPLSGAQYQAVFTNTNGNDTSAPATLTVNPIPSTPTATNSGPVFAGQSLQLFTDTVPGATFSWTGPNSFASSAEDPTIPNATTAASGTYSVTVTVSGCTSSAGQTTATVNSSSAPIVTTHPSSDTVCAPDSTSFTAAATAVPDATVVWEIDTGSGFGTLTIAPPYSVVTNSASGTTTSTLTIDPTSTGLSTNQYRAVFTNFLNSAASNAATLTVNPVPPTPTATNSGPIFAGQNLQLFTDTVPGATYSWTGPNSFSSTAEDPTITGASTAASGTYNVTVTVSGCTSAAGSTTATVLPSAGPNVITDPDDDVACDNGSASFTAAASAIPDAGVVWEIDTGSGFTPLLIASPYSVITNSASGTTTSTLTVNPATLALTGFQYRAVFTNLLGSDTSAAATITVVTGVVATSIDCASPNCATTTNGTLVLAQDRVYTYTVNHTGGTSFLWSLDPGGTILSGQGTDTVTVSFDHTFVANDELSVDVGGPCGPNVQVSKQITVVGFDSQMNAAAAGPIAVPNGWLYVYGLTWQLNGTHFLSTQGLTTANTQDSASYSVPYSDFSMEARMTRTKDPSANICGTCTNGVWVRGTPLPVHPTHKFWNTGYLVQYSANGLYSVWRFNGGNTGIALRPWQMPSGGPGLILTGSGATNTVRVVVSGASPVTIQVWINNNLIDTVTDNTGPIAGPGHVGVVTARLASSGRLDDFAVDYAKLAPTTPELAKTKPSKRARGTKKGREYARKVNRALAKVYRGDAENAPEIPVVE